jgi:protein-disulfide isomerase-like protein with CxxC motif
MSAEHILSLADFKEACGIQEEQGFDAPFVTFTWAHWQNIQAEVVQNFTRFQRAISQQQPQLAALIALEMLHIATELQKEAAAWICVK